MSERVHCTTKSIWLLGRIKLCMSSWAILTSCCCRLHRQTLVCPRWLGLVGLLPPLSKLYSVPPETQTFTPFRTLGISALPYSIYKVFPLAAITSHFQNIIWQHVSAHTCWTTYTAQQVLPHSRNRSAGWVCVQYEWSSFPSSQHCVCVCVCQLKSKPLSSKEEFDFHGGNESSCTTQHRTKQTSVTADYDSGSARYGVKGPGWWWVVKRLAHTQQLWACWTWRVVSKECVKMYHLSLHLLCAGIEISWLQLNWSLKCAWTLLHSNSLLCMVSVPLKTAPQWNCNSKVCAQFKGELRVRQLPSTRWHSKPT